MAIQSNYQAETFSSGSAGGIVEFQGYNVSDLHFGIADSEAVLDSVRLHIETIGQKESHFHGNLGQGYIKQFDKMIISFEYSSILFK